MASVVLCQGQSHMIVQSMKLSVLNHMASVVLSERIYYIIRIVIAFYGIKGINFEVAVKFSKTAKFIV